MDAEGLFWDWSAARSEALTGLHAAISADAFPELVCPTLIDHKKCHAVFSGTYRSCALGGAIGPLARQFMHLGYGPLSHSAYDLSSEWACVSLAHILDDLLSEWARWSKLFRTPSHCNPPQLQQDRLIGGRFQY